jgi:hypothetical protein
LCPMGRLPILVSTLFPGLQVMTVSKLNPRDHIDRHAEQELFRQLASFDSAARMLTICDRGGLGKSSLLKRLRYNCQREFRPPVPACLIELDKLQDPSHFAFVSGIVEELSSVRFAKFNEFDNARVFKIAAAFEDSGDYRSRGLDIRASARAGTVAPGGLSAGVAVQHAERVDLSGERPEFTEEQERRARLRCVEAFFDDLRTICAAQPIVLLLDAWERCNIKLRDWILDELLGNHVLHPDSSLRPDKLGIVIAGRPYHPSSTPEGLRPDELRPFFDSQAELEACVLSIASLSEWDEEHISEFLALNGLDEPSQEDIFFIKFKLRKGWSLEKIVDIIKPLAAGSSATT